MEEHVVDGAPSYAQQPERRRSPRTIAAAVVAGVGALGAGAAAGFAFAGGHASGSLLGSVTSGAGSASGSTSPASVAAAVDPGLVDITSTLAGGQGTAEGTGMVITSSGEVLTNNHVIDGASSITVQIDGSGPAYSASVLGYDATDDVALLQIRGVSNLRTVTLGDSSSLTVGQSVAALGNALGLGGTPAESPGTVSRLNQTITASDSSGSGSETLEGLIEFAASIQPGDSGGALVDSSGHVVGMTTAAEVNGYRQTSVSSTAYAIPIDAAMSIVQQIRSGSA